MPTPSPHVFTMADFVLQPRGPRSFDTWIATKTLRTAVGEFDVELREPADAELVKCVNELVATVCEQSDVILMAIYEDYLVASENKHWMKSCAVPRGLRENQVVNYIRGGALSVRRRAQGTLCSSILISPQWDPEHAVILDVEDGVLVRAN